MKKIILLVILQLSLTTTVFAGGGRIDVYTVDNSNGYYYVNSDMYVLAQVFEPDSGNTVSSVGERAEFRIENPREGDSCVNELEQTTELGLLRARCRTTQPGTIAVYVYSFADNFESSRYLLNFYAVPNPTDFASEQPTAIPTVTRSTPIPPVLSQPTTTSPLEMSPTPNVLKQDDLNQDILIDEQIATDTSEIDFVNNSSKVVSNNSESNTIVLSLALIMLGICIFGVGFIVFRTLKNS